MKRAIMLLVVVAVLVLSFSATALAAPFGLTKSDFKKIASDGQGDWKNIYAWSLASFEGDLYVGTARQAAIAPVMEFMTGAMPGFSMPPAAFPSDSVPFLGTFLAFPPGSPAPVVTDEARFETWNAGSRAEIWRYHAGAWSRVFTSPRVPAAVLGPGGVVPSAPYMTPQSIGFRHMVPFTDKDGVHALYTTSGTFTLAHPAYARLLFMSTNGTDWVPIDTPAAMGRETRSLGVHNGKLYLGIGTAMNAYLPGGATPAGVWCSDDPSDPSSWREVLHFEDVAPANTGVVEMTSANNRLYVGTENAGGFDVWRSRCADPATGADWKCVVKNGAGDRYNGWAGTMETFRNDVYVGSMSVPGITGELAMKAFDLIRIRPDDRWQLLVGNRDPQDPVEGAPLRRPLSGWPSGFGMPTNLYCWNMEVYKGYLYVGSMDMSSMLRAASEAGVAMPDMGIPPLILNVVLKAAGYDLWKSANGTLWLPVTVNGMGDWRNYGTRTMRVHNKKLYIGTANPFRGFQVWEGYDR
jgi:hypothetical protein